MKIIDPISMFGIDSGMRSLVAADAAYAADAAAERSWQADRLRELFPEVTK